MRRNHTDDAERPMSVRQVLAQARTALASQRTMRREIAQATRRALQANRVTIIESLRTAFGRPPAAADAPAAAQKPLKKHGGVWDLETDERRPVENTRKSDAVLHKRVLGVIEQHPEGIRTVDVGNEIGVDWRRVLGITHGLVDEGLVDQVEQNLYPAGKESRRW